jgi:hypothetical protein
MEQLFRRDEASAVFLQTAVGRDEFRLSASPAIPYAIGRIFFRANFICIFVEQYQNNEISLSPKVCFHALSAGVCWISEADDRVREQIYETLTRIKAV